MDRVAIAAALREIGTRLQMQRQSPHRARAYRKGAEALEALNRSLSALIRERTLTEIPGIGSALARTITELAQTGRTALLDQLRQEMPVGAIELGRVLSLPRIRAVEDALGVTTLAGLEAAARDGRLASVPGFGPKTVDRLLHDIESRPTSGVLLHHAQREGEGALAFVRSQRGVARAELAGLLRSRQEVVDRIDIVVGAEDGPAVLERIGTLPQAVQGVADLSSQARCEWMLASGLELSVQIVPPESFAPAWLQRTGSPGHVEALAGLARTRGMELDSHGLSRDGTALPVASEEELYGLLGIPFVPPEMREDDGEVAAAMQGALPSPLVSEAAIQGMVHCHTVYSDGMHSIEQMAKAAQLMGMKYITITDHSPTATYAHGLSAERLYRQWDEIEEVQQKVGVRLLRGSEVDILKDGGLDWPDAILEKMDVVVASIHNRYRLDEAEMTRRVIRGLRHPLFKIWGHALGRYVLRRPPIVVDMDAVLDAAAESRVAIEINGNPHRLDMEPRWVRAARRKGIRFALSVDAHSTSELQNLRWAVDMARRGWLTRADVLNALDADAFAAAVRPAGPV